MLGKVTLRTKVLIGAALACAGWIILMPDTSKTLNEGAIEPWTKPKYRALFTELKRFAKQTDIPLDIP